MEELGNDIGKESQGHEGVNMSLGMPATTSGVDLKGKTSSAVAKQLAFGRCG